MRQILVLEGLEANAEKILRRKFKIHNVSNINALSETQLHSISGIILKSKTLVNHEFLDQFSSNLKIIVRAGTGIENIDVDLLNDRGIKFFNTPNLNSTATAEFILSIVLSCVKKLQKASFQLNDRFYNRNDYISKEFSQINVAVLGVGSIGTKLLIMLDSLNFATFGYNRDSDRITELKQEVPQIAITSNLEDAVLKADVICICLPLSERTMHLIDEALLRKLKDGVIIINCAREKICDTTHVIKYLKNRKIAEYHIDVLQPELPNKGIVKDIHPLLNEPGAIVYPHIAGMSSKAINDISLSAQEIISDFFQKD